MKTKFSVLMSLYYKEKADYAKQCFDSLLRQTIQADEWVIVEDGPLTSEMYQLLDTYESLYPGLIHRVQLKENQGLGLALREGVLHCNCELIARMDTDDIAREDRFAKQLFMFEQDPSLDICGSHINEFEDDIQNIVSVRKVPLRDNEIKKYQRRRDGFNHMTVMYKKEAVLKAGNYQHALLMEDSLLWIHMIQSGSRCANVDDFLVYERVGKDMYNRRGGLEYFKKYYMGRKEIYKTGYISGLDYVYTLIVQLGVAILPVWMRKKVFLIFLRNRK